MKKQKNTASKMIILGYLISFAAILFVINEYKTAAAIRSNPEKMEHMVISADYVDMIPDGLNNYKSKQLTEWELSAILRTGIIKRVIRMNGNGKDAGAMSLQEEKAVCERFKVEFIFMNAHQGLEEGRGFTLSSTQCHEILNEGNVLIHCKHGFHRVGAMVGYHLRQLGFEYEEVVAYNEWETFKIKNVNDQNYWDTIK